MLRPAGKNSLVTTLDTRDGKVISKLINKKGLDLTLSNEFGTYFTRTSSGAVINPLAPNNPTNKVHFANGKDIKLKKHKEETGYKYDSFNQLLTEENYYHVGPKDKGFNLTKKMNIDNPFEWVIIKTNLKSGKTSKISFTPNPLEGDQQSEGHVLIDLNNEGFQILSKKYAKDDENNTIGQLITLLEYNLKGELQEERKFTINNEDKYTYASTLLKGGLVEDFFGGRTINVYTAASTGTVYKNKNENTYLICTILRGLDSRESTTAYIEKKDAQNNSIWSQYIDIFDKAPNKYKLADTHFNPIIAGNKVFYRKTDYSSRNEDGVIVGVIDYETGKISKSTTISDLKGISESDGGNGFRFGRIINNELSENVVLDPNSILAYGANDDVNKFLKAESPSKRTWYYTKINEDSSITIFKANYKKKEYMIYYFK